MTKTKITIILLGLTLLVGGLLIVDHLQNKIAHNQLETLKQLQIEVDEIAKVQLEQEKKIDSLYIEAETLHQAVFGKASYYDYKLESGWSSEGHRVCASRTYKHGTTLVVKNVANDKEVECLVTDYGPDATQFPERIIDLSSYAFSQIADLKLGIFNVS